MHNAVNIFTNSAKILVNFRIGYSYNRQSVFFEKCGAFLLKYHFKNGRGMLYCSNDACETRINHPINKELEKMRERAEAKRKREAEKMAAEAEKKENP